ncbi:uncharacterized protein [Ptychodera flava]|uniref:uncharacterized protein n=1 Tax=Ptychodera flava TaxID=63121 RepID=UPI003969E8CF
MEGIIDKGYAERVPQEELEGNPGKKWYLPHHGVYHPQKQKIRVVFDCGAEYKGTSLNRELMQGPDLTSSLVGVLIRFREEQIALMSDIEAMFSQVGVSQENRDFQRFLWWPNGSVEEPPVEYRMTVHIFGATSSPSCANFALKKSSDNTSDLSVKNTISRNFYVDDMLKPASTVTEGKTLAEGLIDTCKKSGFKLTKWISNTRPVLEAIPEEQRATEVKNLDLEQDDLPTEHALGMQWNVESDVFEFRNRTKEKPATRRGILGVVSSLYDPLGMAAPALLPPKMLLQQLCKAKLGWDDDIPGKQCKVWEKWLSDLPKLEESFTVPRCIKPEYFGDVDVAQLHHFADASENGYGAVSYLRLIDKVGTFMHSN